MATADEVHAFWFGPQPAREPALLRAKMQRWYSAGSALDDQIRKKFGADVELAFKGELDSWASTPAGRISLIVLLDQFPRNIFRDSPRQFEGDKKAQQLAIEALESVLLYNHEERQFLIMPLLHAEDLALQEMAVHEMEAHVEAAPEPLRELYEKGLAIAREYREAIARFGRFPHRNAVLGRANTAEEDDYLRARGNADLPA